MEIEKPTDLLSLTLTRAQWIQVEKSLIRVAKMRKGWLRKPNNQSCNPDRKRIADDLIVDVAIITDLREVLGLPAYSDKLWPGM